MTGAGEPSLPEEAYAVALASLPSIGPSRLRTLLAADPPSVAWAQVMPVSEGTATEFSRSLGR